jgi:hypothetical protein
MLEWTLRELVKQDAKLERLEKSLLTEFHKWASPVDARA